jgi:acyl-CoA synthetase (AMP-forming)/AMP-acid ligase II
MNKNAAIAGAIHWDEAVGAESDSAPVEVMGSMDPFMLIYPSGTTGKPKGTGGGLRNLLPPQYRRSGHVLAQDAGAYGRRMVHAYKQVVDTRRAWSTSIPIARTSRST